MTRRSHGARAVVTGAASGIGQAFAVELGARRGRVVCSDIDLIGAQRTAHIVQDHGGHSIAVACDVSDLAEVQRLSDEAVEWFGGSPSLVVNNAGVGAGGHLIGNAPIEDWEWTLGVNLWGRSMAATSLRRCFGRRDAAASSTSRRPRASALPREWPHTTSARRGCSRCPRPSRPSWPAPVSP